MRLRASRLALTLAGAAAIAALYPAIAQRGPESLLPPGFGDPPPANEQAPPPPDPERSPTNLIPDPALNQGAPLEGGSISDELANVSANNMMAEEATYDLPPEARRSLDRVGLVDGESGGFGPDAFGNANGGFLHTLMRRVDAPLASRWASIVLRRALLSQTDIPAGAGGADWVADRAWLLVRMGEADNARALVQRVDPENYTPWLYTVAMQAALATADPAALCAIADGGAAATRDPAWPLAQAMCAGLAGEGGTASALIDRGRRGRGVDVLLAEKVVGAGTNTRRAVTIQWDGVEQLTAWRYGLATATGVEIPAALLRTAGPQVRAWQARAPLLLPAARMAAADRAATLGVFSSAALVDLYGTIFDDTDQEDRSGTPQDTLRTAFGGETSARLASLRRLWGEGEGNPVRRYAREILTARAAAMLPADAETDAADRDAALAAMLSAGLDRQAARWAAVVGDDGNGRGWGLLAVGAPRVSFAIDAGRVESYRSDAGSDGARRAQFLFAGLAGLGRLGAADIESLAQSFEVPIGRASSLTRALDRAAAARQPGTVALLCAAALQTPSWDYVPPAQLYHIVVALKRVGLDAEARMIAAEALARS